MATRHGFPDVDFSYYDGSTSAKAAWSATQLKQTLTTADTLENGAYHYRFPDGETRELYTDFTTYPDLAPFVLVTRVCNTTQDQYRVTEWNVGDLVIANTSIPTRTAKISDIHWNHIQKYNTIKWAIMGNFHAFYRTTGQKWTSNFGGVQTCSVACDAYRDAATPSNTPSWTAINQKQNGGCGAAQDTGGAWIILTGMHYPDGTYMGGYTGSSGIRGTTPAEYTVATYANNVWSAAGYIWLSW